MRELMEKKIKNYNGNNKVLGISLEGEEILLVIDEPGLPEGKLKDFANGMLYPVSYFKEFRNYSGKFSYSKTRNHDIRAGEYVHGGQNTRR
ncbi:MAG: hypothetical protein H7A25_01945 [Leptospiraceae bacterium]|nr:hypothetical protein [Leptospiraceae bacterium]MCP5498638.1 hypothetical protein [Leptospiraceae bacterium]